MACLSLSNNYDLDTNLNMALMSMRTSVHDTTRFSPFEILYGRTPKTISYENMRNYEENDDIHVDA